MIDSKGQLRRRFVGTLDSVYFGETWDGQLSDCSVNLSRSFRRLSAPIAGSGVSRITYGTPGTSVLLLSFRYTHHANV